MRDGFSARAGTPTQVLEHRMPLTTSMDHPSGWTTSPDAPWSVTGYRSIHWPAASEHRRRGPFTDSGDLPTDPSCRSATSDGRPAELAHYRLYDSPGRSIKDGPVTPVGAAAVDVVIRRRRG